MLNKAQSDAIEFVRAHAKARKTSAITTLEHILKMSDISQSYFNEVVRLLKSSARVAFHFHPDRLDPNMKTVAKALLEGGLYKSQFETLLSSGSVSAHPGGERDLWEKKIFGGAYHQDNSIHASQRPKYGSLDLMGHPDGPSPRFGSCYFLLKAEVTQRCTFTYFDSHQDPIEKGTLDEFDDILAALMSDSFSDEVVLGEHFRPQKLFEHISTTLRKPFENRLSQPHRRNLDHYIEAQVHGPVSLASDVDFLVADPSFKNTAIGKDLSTACEKYEIELHWHAGYVLSTNKVPSDFRGPLMPSLAKRVAPDGLLTTKKIGDAAASVKHKPSAWADRGSEKDVTQELKLLWHVLLRYGQPLL